MSAIRRACAAGLSLILLCLPALAATGVRYSTDPVRLGTFKRTTTLNGEVQYLETQGVYAGARNAKLGEILVQPGDLVEAGQALATFTVSVSKTVETQAEIDLSEATDGFEYALSARAAEIEGMKAALAAETDATGARILELKIMRAELTLSRDRADAEASIAQLTRAYEAARTAEEPRTLGAGIAGVVYTVAQDAPGAAIDPSKLLVAVYNPAKVLVRVDNSAGELKYGMEVELRLNGGPGQATAQGVVVSADNVLPGELRTGAAYIAYDATARSGYTNATVVATTMAVPDALIAPTRCVSFDNGRNYVRVLAADGTVHTRYVVKAMDAGSDAWIVLGAVEGDKLIAK